MNKRLRTVTPKEYWSFVVKHSYKLTCHVTEGFNLSVCQYLDEGRVVRAQVLYQQIGGVVSATHEIDMEWGD